MESECPARINVTSLPLVSCRTGHNECAGNLRFSVHSLFNPRYQYYRLNVGRGKLILSFTSFLSLSVHGYLSIAHFLCAETYQRLFLTHFPRAGIYQGFFVCTVTYRCMDFNGFILSANSLTLPKVQPFLPQ